MKRGLMILSFGLVGGIVTFCCVYLTGTATPRALMRSVQPELAWLKYEFSLDDNELKRVAEFHAAYLPQCQERCRRIDNLNDQLSNALATATEITPKLEALLTERAQMRVTCQTEMLKHFFEVSRTMPPAQGKRYLAWVRDNTCLRESAMGHGTAGHAGKASADRHP